MKKVKIQVYVKMLGLSYKAMGAITDKNYLIFFTC